MDWTEGPQKDKNKIGQWKNKYPCRQVEEPMEVDVVDNKHLLWNRPPSVHQNQPNTAPAAIQKKSCYGQVQDDFMDWTEGPQTDNQKIGQWKNKYPCRQVEEPMEVDVVDNKHLLWNRPPSVHQNQPNTAPAAIQKTSCYGQVQDDFMDWTEGPQTDNQKIGQWKNKYPCRQVEEPMEVDVVDNKHLLWNRPPSVHQNQPNTAPAAIQKTSCYGQVQDDFMDWTEGPQTDNQKIGQWKNKYPCRQVEEPMEVDVVDNKHLLWNRPPSVHQNQPNTAPAAIQKKSCYGQVQDDFMDWTEGPQTDNQKIGQWKNKYPCRQVEQPMDVDVVENKHLLPNRPLSALHNQLNTAPAAIQKKSCYGQDQDYFMDWTEGPQKDKKKIGLWKNKYPCSQVEQPMDVDVVENKHLPPNRPLSASQNQPNTAPAAIQKKSCYGQDQDDFMDWTEGPQKDNMKIGLWKNKYPCRQVEQPMDIDVDNNQSTLSSKNTVHPSQSAGTTKITVRRRSSKAATRWSFSRQNKVKCWPYS
ncbi:uncharacterized protein LOC114830082 [Esox lucius]|uniref:uncharacterized protein LOC114830082 n=1 Tax=Esox lucius TaxID=8010 RepID=UPI0014769145|nr:uncharacterized protein LOC114830082 [Esox lucius]